MSGSSVDRAGGSTPHDHAPEAHEHHLIDDLLHQAELALQLPETPGERWHEPGISTRAERLLGLLGGAAVLLIAIGWAWTLATGRMQQAAGEESVVTSATSNIAAALSNRNAPTAAYVNDALLDRIASRVTGRSGQLRAIFQPAGAALPAGEQDAHLVAQAPGSSDTVPVQRARPGIYRLAAAVGTALRPVANMNVIAMHPFGAKREGRIGEYRIGSWPSEFGVRGPKAAPAAKYANPAGFIEVTLQNRDTPVSEHFTLRDFLTKGQESVWPKYLVLRPELVDKLELVLAELRAQGINTRGVFVMSGFRTPQYNKGGGNTSGRANLSRHMYGDAADIWIDNDGNGTMDDLNKDGRVSVEDARFMAKAAERVEQKHPELIGGIGVYPAASGHGPFIHVDTRGYRARW